MRSAFIDKLIKRMDRLEPGEVQGIVLELAREKKFQEKVFEALQEGVILLDTEAKVTYVNRAACTFFGLERDQVLGQRLAQGVRGLDWSELLIPGTIVSRDLEVFYPENRYLNFYITSIDDDASQGFVMLIRDVTETRKRTEEQLESERLNAFTLLAAGVAHELGNPLNSLTIHLQLLERRLKKMGAKGASLNKYIKKKRRTQMATSSKPGLGAKMQAEVRLPQQLSRPGSCWLALHSELKKALKKL
jgi:two-component system, sporulation sensor kinase E